MKAKFKVITPIHIGNGEILNRFDYVLYEDGIGLIDKEKFNKRISRDKKLFDEFLKVSENVKNLVDFLDENILDEEVSEIIETNDEILDTLEKNYSRGIDLFIKDKFLTIPIISGSSIKGAIRTAILNYVVNYHPELKKINNPNKLEKEVFGDIKEDILKALFVDDFKPLNYKKRIISPLNRGKKDNPIPVLLEVITDGEFEGEIRIDEYLLKNVNNKYFNLDYEFIKIALEFHYENILNYENKKFKANKLPYQKFMIKIGKHAGAGSKSIENRKVFIKQLEKKLPYQTSIWVDEENYPLGWGKLGF
jgi:CRISPR/Cas system CSM-associated protein Csm5 (group 7 of RAMP superfamily)